MWTYSRARLGCQSSSELKILSYSVTMNSAIWFWYTMCTATFPDSFSALRRVGPNTIPKLCVDMRFWEALATILGTRKRNKEKMPLEFNGKLWQVIVPGKKRKTKNLCRSVHKPFVKFRMRAGPVVNSPVSTLKSSLQMAIVRIS